MTTELKPITLDHIKAAAEWAQKASEPCPIDGQTVLMAAALRNEVPIPPSVLGLMTEYRYAKNPSHCLSDCEYTARLYTRYLESTKGKS